MEAEFEFEKATKRTYRFKETTTPELMGTVYIQQHFFEKQPKRIKVTVEVLE